MMDSRPSATSSAESGGLSDHMLGGDNLTRRAMLKRMGALGVGVASGGALLSACGSSSPSGSSATGSQQQFKGQTLIVTSYGATWQQFMENVHLPPFEQMTGAKVELAVGVAVDWFSKMQAAGPNNPPYDVFVGNETYVSELRSRGFFQALPTAKVPNLKYVPAKLRQPNNVGVLGLLTPLGVMYSTERVKNPPKSWLDLARFRGKVGIFTIGNSGSPQFIMKLAQVLNNNPENWQPAVQWIAKNLCGAQQVDLSTTLLTQITQGQIDVGLIDSADWATLKAKGGPVDFIEPKEGYCGMFEQDMNVCKGSKVKELGYAFINYWLSTSVQKKWADQFYYAPANTQVKVTGKLKTLVPVTRDDLSQIPKWDYNWLNTSGARNAMTTAWDHEMSSC